MPSEVGLKYGSRTGEGVVDLFTEVESLAQPTIGDLLFTAQRQRSRILQRTARGVDVNETAFTPYSAKGPIYYYPGTQTKNRKAAVNRIARKIGITGNSKTIAVKGLKGQYVQKTGKGLKFSSYAALKAAFGRLTVDLRGLVAPHMLQAMVVRVQEFSLGIDTQTFQSPQTVSPAASEFAIGIYGTEAERARGHQKGNPKTHLPQRKFLGANENDKTLMVNDILSRMVARIRKTLGVADRNENSL